MTARDVVLRRAGPDDVDAVVGVNRAAAEVAYATIFAGAPYPVEAIQRRYRGLLASRDVAVVVADRDGRVVGYAAAAPGRLDSLYVVPEAWGTGLAQRLYEAVEPLLGSGEATLWVLEENDRGRRFWERNGWRATGEASHAHDRIELLYRKTLP